MTLGDRIVIMKEGFVQQVGTPQEVFHHPANLFVAGFIGSPQMNTFDARLIRTGDRYSVEVGGATVALSPEKCRRLAAAGAESREVVLGIRPEHIALSGGPGSVPAEVDVSEMMGSAVHIHVRACGREAVIVVPVSEEAAERGEDTLAAGTAVGFTFRGSAVHVFDRETGINLEFPPAAPAEEPPEEPQAEPELPPPPEAPAAAAEEVPPEAPFPVRDLGDPFAED